jgi:aminotransferase in exopolysaccharide biosynthesis
MQDCKDFISFVKEKFKTNSSIHLHEPVFFGNEKIYLNECIDSTFVSSIGKFVDTFESMMAKITQSKKAISVVNGTAGIHIALMLAGVKSNDEILTQALTFVATANAISYCNAHPVFLDVDLDTMGLSPRAVESFLLEFGELREDGCYNKKTGRKISACLPMHTFGFPVHLDELIHICKLWNIPIVEDAAESLGSEYKERPTGSFGKLGVFSFNGNKIVTSGGGGAIVTNDYLLAEKGKHLTTTAKVSHPYKYEHDELGYNYRLPNLNAALACAQLEQLSNFLKNKRLLANDYKSYFKNKGILFRSETPETKANYWLMCIELESKRERDLFLKETHKNKIMTRPIWKLLFHLPMYKHCQKDNQKNAMYLEQRIVNIPSRIV